MLLLDALVAHAPEEAVCEKTFRQEDLFVKDGVVSGFVALELFAQAAAAHFGYVGLTAGGKATSGALLGARKIELLVPTFAVGEKLTIRVKQVMAMPPAAQFDCTLHGPDGTLLAEGVISVAVGVEAP
jgi:predicted hotdog family 3-hydroxylacyl-ACP dehydratase